MRRSPSFGFGRGFKKKAADGRPSRRFAPLPEQGEYRRAAPSCKKFCPSSVNFLFTAAGVVEAVDCHISPLSIAPKHAGQHWTLALEGAAFALFSA
jgi:hypothetical protein